MQLNEQNIELVNKANKVIVLICYALYPLLLILVFITQRTELLRFILVPGIGFAAVSVFRNLYNAPRPYEVTGIPPLLKKDTKGKSFPSRHVFSIFMIAYCWFVYCAPVGIILFILGAGLAVLRVKGGVHWTKDVIAGALCALVFGFIGFNLIP